MSWNLRGNVLPTVLAVAVVILTGLAGLLMLYGDAAMLFARTARLRQSRADVESAYVLYARYPRCEELSAAAGFRLYDSVPASRVLLRVRPWGLYELVEVTTADSVCRTCRIFGADVDVRQTLCYADGGSPVSLAGRCVLHGELRLPANGVLYSRVGSDYFDGEQIGTGSIRRSGPAIPRPDSAAERRVARLFAASITEVSPTLPDSLGVSFLHDSTAFFALGDAEIANCTLRGNIVLFAGELRIDSTCRMENVVVCARKVIVGRGAHISGQFFARDTVIVEPRSELRYPSGIYARHYAEVGEHVRLDGYAIVVDTLPPGRLKPNYRQSKAARVRGLVWVGGIAEVRGVVAGRLIVRKAVYFASEGYYENTLYDLVLLENPLTTQPLWLAGSGARRKEALCVD